MNRLLKIEYGGGVLSLPREGLLAALPAANELNLKVLLLVVSDDKLRENYEACCAELRSRLDITQSTLERAFTFWEKAGVLSITADTGKPSEMSGGSNRTGASDNSNSTSVSGSSNRAGVPDGGKQSAKPLLSSTLPSYTQGQCADIIAESGELADLIEICQRIVGKIFTPSDVEIIVVLFDHLGLNGEYIANLFAYCVGNEKKSLRYIEKTALNLFDEGIDTSDALTAYIKRKENLEDNIKKIRRLIGAASRELTPKEKKFFNCWLDEWRLDIDIITRAYEVTVDKINEPSVSYMNRVLENWHNAGLNTLEAVEASLETYKKNKEEAAHTSQTVNGTESGFRTDEFFEAALRRSYRDNEKEG